MATATIAELTIESFEGAVEHGVVVVDVWAPWCAPCRSFAPTFAAAAARHPGVAFAKVNTEAEPRLAAELGVRAIPTLLVFRDGILVASHAGAVPGAVVDGLIRQAAGLDMVAVRGQLRGAMGHR